MVVDLTGLIKNVEHPGNFAESKSNSGSQIRKPGRSYPANPKEPWLLVSHFEKDGCSLPPCVILFGGLGM